MHRDGISIEGIAPATAALPTRRENVANAHLLQARLRSEVDPVRLARKHAVLRRAICPSLDDGSAWISAKKTARIRDFCSMGHDEGLGFCDAGQGQRDFRRRPAPVASGSPRIAR